MPTWTDISVFSYVDPADRYRYLRLTNLVAAHLSRAGFTNFGSLTAGFSYEGVVGGVVYFECEIGHTTVGARLEFSKHGRAVKGDLRRYGDLVARVTKKTESRLILENHALDLILEKGWSL
jgi:hypothetical protein